MASDAQVRGELEITRDDVAQRIEFQERKRLTNIRDVVAVAAEVLGDKEVDDHEPDPDWTARYFDYVQDVTSEDLKKLWARILAGEVETPGRTSLRTLSILRDMSQRDTLMFHAIMEYVISDFIFVDYCTSSLRQAEGHRTRKDHEFGPGCFRNAGRQEHYLTQRWHPPNRPPRSYIEHCRCTRC